jgi:hypothetical protein
LLPQHFRRSIIHCRCTVRKRLLHKYVRKGAVDKCCVYLLFRHTRLNY